MSNLGAWQWACKLLKRLAIWPLSVRESGSSLRGQMDAFPGIKPAFPFWIPPRGGYAQIRSRRASIPECD